MIEYSIVCLYSGHNTIEYNPSFISPFIVTFSARHSSSPIQHHNDLSSDFDGSSDYSSTYSGDDSGFSESSKFLKGPLVKHGTRVLPVLPPHKAASSNGHYYKSLNKHEGVSYYKTLQKGAVEGQL